ncbi:hypothetical protein [Massilia sp. TS11]|uniref:hypothetical protein n=1 Tax=Massilia sp. TS11 TaxID=2908003 RepID=UPI001EDA25B8|nr:hypothetical protein [Massilia sp. TS11]MCG2583909.1 hypothetical protein [Massilia sp. TS11]
MRSKIALVHAFVLALAALLAGCAVNKQGNNYQFGIDHNELLGRNLQDFQLGDSKGVLRLNAQGQLQIKLYDRMKVLDLGGQVKSAYVAYAERYPRYDVLVVHMPTPSCPHAYRVYQLAGYEVNMWEMNTASGRCQTPLVFTLYADGWSAREDKDQGARQRWNWYNGWLTGGMEQVPTAAAVAAPPGAPRPATETRPATATFVSTPPATATAPAREARPRAHFESGAVESAAPTTPRSAAPLPAGNTATTTVAKTAVATSASSSGPKPINAGNYEKLPATAQSEITPVKITLHDGN